MPATLEARPTVAPGASRDLQPLVLSGTDPRTGLEGTWHIEPLPSDECRVEWAYGRVTDPRHWVGAHKVTTILSAAKAADLVHRVTGA